MMIEVWERCFCRRVDFWWDGGRAEYAERPCVQQAQGNKVIDNEHWVSRLRPVAEVLAAAKETQ
jgi:hypothetical protein